MVVNMYGSPIPADGSTYTVSMFGTAGTSNPIVSVGGKSYVASSGTVTANIVGGKVRISFPALKFQNITNATDTKMISGQATVQ